MQNKITRTSVKCHLFSNKEFSVKSGIQVTKVPSSIPSYTVGSYRGVSLQLLRYKPPAPFEDRDGGCARMSLSRTALQARLLQPAILQTRALSGSGYGPPPQLTSVTKNWGQLYESSLTDREQFFGSLANQRLRWQTPFREVCRVDHHQGQIEWFLGGKLNVSGKKCSRRFLQFFSPEQLKAWGKSERCKGTGVCFFLKNICLETF